VLLIAAACRNGRFLFDFVISTGYPYDAPKVKCKTKVRAAAGLVLHPNRQLQG
jgi:ubiquitin-protein ligase